MYILNVTQARGFVTKTIGVRMPSYTNRCITLVYNWAQTCRSQFNWAQTGHSHTKKKKEIESVEKLILRFGVMLKK